LTDYITQANLKNSVSLAGQTYADEDIARAITTASMVVDQIAGPFPTAGTADTIRYYTPSTDGVLRIDPLSAITSLQTDSGGDGTYEDTWTENSDFRLLPLNAAADGVPWTSVELNRAGAFSRFPQCFPAGVKITGKFGYTDERLAGVRTATTILAARLLARQRIAPLGVIDIGPDGGVVRLARSDPDVMMALSPYPRKTPLFV
jgi:hypothetical protein